MLQHAACVNNLKVAYLDLGHASTVCRWRAAHSPYAASSPSSHPERSGSTKGVGRGGTGGHDWARLASSSGVGSLNGAVEHAQSSGRRLAATRHSNIPVDGAYLCLARASSLVCILRLLGMLAGLDVDRGLLFLGFLHSELHDLQLGGVALPRPHLPPGDKGTAESERAPGDVSPRWEDHVTGIPAAIQPFTSKHGHALIHSFEVIRPSWFRSGDQSRWPLISTPGWSIWNRA